MHGAAVERIAPLRSHALRRVPLSRLRTSSSCGPWSRALTSISCEPAISLRCSLRTSEHRLRRIGVCLAPESLIIQEFSVWPLQALWPSPARRHSHLEPLAAGEAASLQLQPGACLSERRPHLDQTRRIPATCADSSESHSVAPPVREAAMPNLSSVTSVPIPAAPCSPCIQSCRPCQFDGRTVIVRVSV